MMFSLSKTQLEDIQLRQTLASSQAGALCCFEGRVRNFNDGKNVSFLEYEADEAICKKEADKIFKEAKVLYNIIDIKCFHRVGKLKVGEMAVWIGVLSAHRDDAFKACRYVIDEIKKRLPIWKKEFYLDGESTWIEGCEHSRISIDDRAYYQKHLMLSEIGVSGQEKLNNARVLVIGAGGLGCSVLTSLANAGIGTIGICEYDIIETSNLHRQFLYKYDDVSKRKADVARARLKDLNPSIIINTYELKLNKVNVSEIFADYEYIVDCTDNFDSKFLINDACFTSGRPLIQSSIYQFEGQLRVFDPAVQSGCLRCVWPQTPEPGCTGNCQDAGVLGLVPNVFGHLQAWETIKAILKMPDSLTGKTLIMNLMNYQTTVIKEPKNDHCPLCGNHPELSSESFKNNDKDEDLLIDITELSTEEIKHYQWIDIREEFESIVSPIENFPCIQAPMSDIKDDNFTFKKDNNYVLICTKGIRSLKLTKELRASYPNIFSLKNGMQDLDEFQDPSYA